MKHKIGWAVLLAWIAWWTFFVVAGGIVSEDKAGTALRLAVFVLVFGGGTGVALWRPRLGGAVLIATGVGLATVIMGYLKNPAPTNLWLLVTMALPPILAGTLLRARE